MDINLDDDFSRIDMDDLWQESSDPDQYDGQCRLSYPQGLGILKDIESEVIDEDDTRESLNRSASFVRKRDYFEAMASLNSLSGEASSGDNLDKTDIRPHPSQASQNLINVTASSETNSVGTLHVTKTSSDTFIHTKGAKDGSASSMQSEGGATTSPPLARKSSSTPQLHKWGGHSSDSGRSSGVVSPKNDLTNTQETLTETSLRLEVVTSDDLPDDDCHGNADDGQFTPTGSQVTRSLDGDILSPRSTGSLHDAGTTSFISTRSTIERARDKLRWEMMNGHFIPPVVEGIQDAASANIGSVDSHDNSDNSGQSAPSDPQTPCDLPLEELNKLSQQEEMIVELVQVSSAIHLTDAGGEDTVVNLAEVKSELNVTPSQKDIEAAEQKLSSGRLSGYDGSQESSDGSQESCSNHTPPPKSWDHLSSASELSRLTASPQTITSMNDGRSLSFQKMLKEKRVSAANDSESSAESEPSPKSRKKALRTRSPVDPSSRDSLRRSLLSYSDGGVVTSHGSKASGGRPSILKAEGSSTSSHSSSSVHFDEKVKMTYFSKKVPSWENHPENQPMQKSSSESNLASTMTSRESAAGQGIPVYKETPVQGVAHLRSQSAQGQPRETRQATRFMSLPGVTEQLTAELQQSLGQINRQARDAAEDEGQAEHPTHLTRLDSEAMQRLLSAVIHAAVQSVTQANPNTSLAQSRTRDHSESRSRSAQGQTSSRIPESRSRSAQGSYQTPKPKANGPSPESSHEQVEQVQNLQELPPSYSADPTPLLQYLGQVSEPGSAAASDLLQSLGELYAPRARSAPIPQLPDDGKDWSSHSGQKQRIETTNLPTPSTLLKRHNEQAKLEQQSGVGSFPSMATASNLLKRYKEQALVEQRGGVGEVPSMATPSLLLKRQMDQSVPEARSGAGSFPSISTNSNLLKRPREHANVEERGGVGSFPRMTTPSNLLQRNQEQAQLEERGGVGSFARMTTPSNLLNRHHEQAQLEERDGVGSFARMTTPSNLLQRHQEQAQLEERGGVGSFARMTTPSNLLNRHQEQAQLEERDGVGSFARMTTPSNLLQRHQEQAQLEERDGVGSFARMTTPSNLLNRHQEQAQLEERDGVGSFARMTTPSNLLNRHQEQAQLEERDGVGSFARMTTPSNLLNRHQEQAQQEERGGVGSFPSMTTPSNLLHRHQEQAQLEERGGVGSFPSMTTPSALLSNWEKQKRAEERGGASNIFSLTSPSSLVRTQQEQTKLDHGNGVGSIASMPTPSTLLKRNDDQARVEEGAGVGSFASMTTPSTLLKRHQEQAKLAESGGVGSFPSMTTPSNLLKRHQEQAQLEERGGVGSFPSMTTPSTLLKRHQNQAVLEERSGVGSFEEMVAPSTLLERHTEQSNGSPQGLPQNQLSDQSTLVQIYGTPATESGMDYSTPSKLYSLIEARERANQLPVSSEEQFKETMNDSPMSSIGISPDSSKVAHVGSESTSSDSDTDSLREKWNAILSWLSKSTAEMTSCESSPGGSGTSVESSDYSSTSHDSSSQDSTSGFLQRLLCDLQHRSHSLPELPTHIRDMILQVLPSLHSLKSSSEYSYGKDHGASTAKLQVKHKAKPDKRKQSTEKVKYRHAPYSLRQPEAEKMSSRATYTVDSPSAWRNDEDSYDDVENVPNSGFHAPSASPVASLLSLSNCLDEPICSDSLVQKILDLCQQQPQQRCYSVPHATETDTRLKDAQAKNRAKSCPGQAPNCVTFSPSLRTKTVSVVSSGGNSPVPDHATPSGATKRSRTGSGSASSDIRTFIVEKEVIESQLRKLQVENSTLHTENKLLKDRYNRSQAKVQQIQSELLASEREADRLQGELSQEMLSVQRESRQHEEQNQWRLEEQIVRLKKDLEVLRAENASLRKQLDSNNKHTVDHAQRIGDRSLIIESYKVQVNSLKEEVRRARQLLEESETARQSEVDRRKDASAQVVKLTQMKALLQQQIENAGGGTVAQKQVKSLEQRLHITEQRLHQERADRASKLSEVEEDLINQNARLQVAEKELTRKLQREQERSKNLDRKYREAREQKESLQLEILEKPSSLLNNNNNTYSKLNGSVGNKSSEEVVTSALAQIRQAENLEEADDGEVITVLWQQKQAVAKQLKEWEIQLSGLEVDQENITEGLKTLQDERLQFTSQLQQYQDSLEDCNKHREELERTNKGQIHDLVEEKHTLQSTLRNVEDSNAAITAENESLRNSLLASSGPPSRQAGVNPWEGQVEALKCDVITTRGDLERQSRASRLLQSELESLRTQLAAKERALEEALWELQLFPGGGASAAGEASSSQQRQQTIEKLHAELRGMQAEVELWQDKCRSATRERSHLQEQVTSLSMEITRLKVIHTEVNVTTPDPSADVALVESELQEKDVQVLRLTVQYNEVENELQRCKQQILREKQQNEDLCVQLDELQAELRERNRAVERLTSTEDEYHVELKASRNNLSAANRDLTQTAAQLKLREVDVTRHREKIDKLERDLNHREEMLSQNIVRLLEDGTVRSAVYSGATTSPRHTLTQAETSVRLLQYDKEKLQHDMQQAQRAIQMVVDENAQLTTRIRELHQQLANERAQLCHMTSDKVELNQRLHLCTEEKDALVKEKTRLTSDLARHEVMTSQVMQKLEQEAQNAGVDYEQQYRTVDAHGKKLAMELGTSRRLLEAREREIDLLRDTTDRQKQEIDTLCRRIQVLTEENMSSREDMSRLTSNLSSKLKDTVESTQVAQYLNSEKTKLEMEKFQLENNWDKERGEVERRTGEIAQLQKKLEQSEERQHHTEQMLHQRETQLVAMEAELRHAGKSTAQVDCDRRELKAQVERLNEEIRSLTAVNSVLEQRLSNEKQVVTDEKSDHQQLRTELERTTRQMEALRQEHEILSANLDSERRRVQTLKDQCHNEEDKSQRSEDRSHAQQLELDSVKSHLVESRNTIDQFRKDKQTLYQDVQDLCRKLSDRDETIGRLQHKCSDAVENMHKDYATEKTVLVEDKRRMEDSLLKAKEDSDNLNQKLAEKENQLDAYFRTQKDLEQETKARLELESQISSLDGELNEMKHALNTVQSENERLVEHSKQTQETLDRTRESNITMKEEMRVHRDTYTKEIHEVRHTLAEEKHKQETDKSDLQDEYNKVLANSRAMEVALSAVTESKESLFTSNKTYEQNIDSLKTQLHEETTTRKLAEQRVETLTTQLTEVQTTKAGYDVRSAELQTHLAKVQAEYGLEKERCKKLKREFNEMQATSYSHETRCQTLQIQVTELQSEVASLSSHLETTTQDLSGKNSRLAQELKQQSEDLEKEHDKLLMQAQQLSVELEKTREQIALKNQDALRMQEEVLSLEEKLREATSQLKQAQESLNIELETRDKLDQRNMELEMLIVRLRSRDGDDDFDLFDQTSTEVSRRIQELSRHTREQLDNQRAQDSEIRGREMKRIEELKKKIASLESELSQEQAMHIVTKTQLSSLEEDNQRLRQQLQAARKRVTTAAESDRSKSRMEEINEIIMRSQTRAQQMIASGAYGEDPLRTLSPSRDFLSATAPASTYLNTSTSPEQLRYSDLNRSMGSDDIKLMMSSTPEKKL